MKKYICPICGYVYDEEKEGVKFEDLPNDWKCPLCGAPKDLFKEEAIEVNVDIEDDNDELREMNYGEISALCSSLAKGCEKQYLYEEASLFMKLSNYYNNKAKETGNFSNLIDKINNDLNINYKNARKIATEKKDRGALRVITWGEKVSMILKSLIDKDIPTDKKIFVCDICGFVYIGESKPEICPVCKVPSFKLTKIKGGI